MRHFLLILILLFNWTLYSQNTVLWKVTNEGSEKTSYLMGTFHPMGAHFVDTLYPVIKNKLTQSELAIFEIVGENDDSKKKILKRKEGFQYRKTLKKKYVKKLEQITEKAKLPLSKLSPVEIRFLLVKLHATNHCENYLPTDSLIQLDKHLELLAKEQSIAVKGLETDSLQVAAINRDNSNIDWYTLKENKHFLNTLYYWIDVNSGMDDSENVCILSRKYKTLDLDYQFQKNCPDDVLIKERNENWMAKIPDYLARKNCFIAVGLHHLYGDCGLIVQLQTKGFSVQPVTINN